MTAQDKNETIKPISENAAFILGGGNDEVKFSPADLNVYYLGSGDDRAEKSMGVGIFIFETGWGRDEILLSPDELHTVIDTGKIVDYDGSYPYRFRSFFVFGNGIKSEDMRWRREVRLLKFGRDVPRARGHRRGRAKGVKIFTKSL
ncbi:hypothetical protein [uncultured Campylobacter sp.]|uniref:hypothetical protein n=1 Tax=uncultured Campylobacter sp. TaxID=218934 RepID=UPI0026371F5F|nr:hypothetical protein [uncultured Campylobacter sp.]